MSEHKGQGAGDWAQDDLASSLVCTPFFTKGSGHETTKLLVCAELKKSSHAIGLNLPSIQSLC